MRPLEAAWERAFLEERPSLSLGLFRIALAAAVGLHVWPTLFAIGDNYLSGAFKEYNAHFFPFALLVAADGSPDWLVWLVSGAFALSWLLFLLGWKTQKSGIAMAACCYFFYARNALHVGTLSWDIMLVTLFLCLVTPYPGDSFSLDSILAGDAAAYGRRRPFFVQRLLQVQLAWTFFQTGLAKWTAGGNWLSGNPYLYLMNSPPTSVVKAFPGREFLAGQPALCWRLGVALIAFEMTLWLWLWWRKTRPWAIAAGIAFHFMLLFTLHVPTIFFFLFPPQLLLFVEPERLAGWLEARRSAWRERGRDRLLYDGDCRFCRAWAARVSAADPTGRLALVDFRRADLKALDPRLSAEALEARLHLLERGGRLSAGFEAFKRLSVRLPLLWPLAPAFHIPGAGLVGAPAYDLVARLRYRLSESLSGR